MRTLWLTDFRDYRKEDAIRHLEVELQQERSMADNMVAHMVNIKPLSLVEEAMVVILMHLFLWRGCWACVRFK